MGIKEIYKIKLEYFVINNFLSVRWIAKKKLVRWIAKKNWVIRIKMGERGFVPQITPP